MTTRRKTKAERERIAHLARQRRRAHQPSPGQADRNAIGVAFCRATLRSVQSYREAKRGKGT